MENNHRRWREAGASVRKLMCSVVSCDLSRSGKSVVVVVEGNCVARMVYVDRRGGWMCVSSK